MRIDLSRGDVGMTQQHLHHPKIGSVVQEMAGEGVAQHVRAHLGSPESRCGGKRPELAGKMLALQLPHLAKGGKKPFRLLASIRRPKSARYSCMACLAASLSG